MNIELMYDGKIYPTDILGSRNVKIETNPFSVYIARRDLEDVSTIDRLLNAPYNGITAHGTNFSQPLDRIEDQTFSFAKIDVEVKKGKLYLNDRDVKEFIQ